MGVVGGGEAGDGVGGGTYSITAVHPVRPVRNTFGFCAISFERIGVLKFYTQVYNNKM